MTYEGDSMDFTVAARLLPPETETELRILLLNLAGEVMAHGAALQVLRASLDHLEASAPKGEEAQAWRVWVGVDGVWVKDERGIGSVHIHNEDNITVAYATSLERAEAIVRDHNRDLDAPAAPPPVPAAAVMTQADEDEESGRVAMQESPRECQHRWQDETTISFLGKIRVVQWCHSDCGALRFRPEPKPIPQSTEAVG